MNRRKLFQLIGGAVLAASIELTGIIPVITRKAKYILNPAYMTAEYEDAYVMTASASNLLRFKRCGDPDHSIHYFGKIDGIVCSREVQQKLPKIYPQTIDCQMPRYNFIDGEWVQVPMFVEEEA